MNKLWLLFVFAAVLLLYYPVINTYFSQDDFFMFRASLTDGSLQAFINLFGFPSFEERGYAFYRPVFREGLHNLYFSFFGLNHIPMRILLLSIHITNTALSYFIVLKLFKNQKIAVFTAFFFGITAAHAGTLYYMAGGLEVAGATSFIFSAVLLFIIYLEKKTVGYLIGSFIIFLLALASHELAVIMPFILAGIIFVQWQPKQFLQRVRIILWPFFAAWILYLYLDVVKIGFLQQEQQYRINFDIGRAINSFGWYAVWAWGLPEMMIDFVGSGFVLNPNLMKFWGNYFVIIFPSFLISIGMFFAILVYLLFKNIDLFKDKALWLSILWFPLALSPIILLPLHKSTHYLSPALIAFWSVVGFLGLRAYWNFAKQNCFLARGLFIMWLASLVMLSAASVRLSDETYPAANRGRIAQKLINDIQVQYPQLPKGAVVFIKNDPDYPKISGDWGGSSKQAAFVLNGSDALQLLYRDTTLKVYYEDLGGLPELPQSQAFPITAKIQLE